MYTFLFTSLDTLLAAFGFGVLAPGSVNRRVACTTFFAADALASVCGLLLRNTSLAPSRSLITPVTAALYLLLVGCLVASIVKGRVRVRSSLACVAVFLSVDNLVAAASAHANTGLFPSVLLPAGATALAALLGIAAAQSLSMRWHSRCMMWTGIACVAVPALIR